MLRLLTTQEACAYTRQRRTRLYQLAAEGRLTKYGKPRHLLWDMTELSRVIREPLRLAA